MAIKVETAERIAANARYDIALVTVRRDQLASAVPELKADRSIPNFLFMLNNPTGTESLAEGLGRDRVLLGFPGAGGTRDRHVIHYALIPQQPTTLGEMDGQPSSRDEHRTWRRLADYNTREFDRLVGMNRLPLYQDGESGAGFRAQLLFLPTRLRPVMSSNKFWLAAVKRLHRRARPYS